MVASRGLCRASRWQQLLLRYASAEPGVDVTESQRAQLLHVANDQLLGANTPQRDGPGYRGVSAGEAAAQS